MGQYHLIANLTKKEFLYPHRFNEGLKMLEFGCDGRGILCALTLLLACSHERGGGDYHPRSPEDRKWMGRWTGDKIAIVGDYTELEDLPLEFEADTIYDSCLNGQYEDISEPLYDMVRHID